MQPSLDSQPHIASDSPPQENAFRCEVCPLFALVALGIFAKWFWGVCWQFLTHPQDGFPFCSPAELAVRILVCCVAAALTFLPAYDEIKGKSSPSWVQYVMAFQHGFIWFTLMEAAHPTLHS